MFVPSVPVTVTVYVPVATPLGTVIVTVDVPVPEVVTIEAGLKDAVNPPVAA